MSDRGLSQEWLQMKIHGRGSAWFAATGLGGSSILTGGRGQRNELTTPAQASCAGLAPDVESGVESTETQEPPKLQQGQEAHELGFSPLLRQLVHNDASQPY